MAALYTHTFNANPRSRHQKSGTEAVFCRWFKKEVVARKEYHFVTPEAIQHAKDVWSDYTHNNRADLYSALLWDRLVKNSNKHNLLNWQKENEWSQS